jgi:hypothetical protein
LPDPVKTPSDVPEKMCTGCALGKSTRAPFTSHMNPSVAADGILDRVHGDLCGPIRVGADHAENEKLNHSLVGDKKYMSVLVDEKSRRGVVTLREEQE